MNVAGQSTRRLTGEVVFALLLTGAVLLLTGCAPAPTTTATPTVGTTDTSSTAPPTTVTPASVSSTVPAVYSQPSHRIGIRGKGADAEFYDRKSGDRFVPVGPNLHFLALEGDTFVDRLFAPSSYDPERVDAELSAMRALGYTVVRTSLDLCVRDCIGAAGGGLRDDYLDDVADFLGRAQNQGLFVILTSNDLPVDAGYVPRVEATCCDPFDGYLNSHYLSAVGVTEWSRYWRDVLSALIERRAPLEVILAYELRGELFLSSDKPPLSLDDGIVTTANGEAYDLSDPVQKLKMVDDGVQHWIDSVAGVIRELDPTALVTVGVFPPNSPNEWRPGDNRLVPKASTFAASNIDFLDLHVYPGYLPFPAMMEDFGIEADTELPRVLGEFGGFTFVYGSPEDAAFGVQEWQVASCRHGVIGWMFWHWTGANDHEVWTGSEGSGAIRQVLAPVNRTDACESASFPFFVPDLAHRHPARASRSLPEGSAAKAVDGWRSTSWQSGDGPPQWIEVDLARPSRVEEIRLAVSQFPSGETHHRILVAGPDRAFRIVGELAGETADGDELRLAFEGPLTGVEFVRIETVVSPSWVSWREIRILGEAMP